MGFSYFPEVIKDVILPHTKRRLDTANKKDEAIKSFLEAEDFIDSMIRKGAVKVVIKHYAHTTASGVPVDSLKNVTERVED